MPAGAVAKIRRGAADSKGKPSKPHIPSAKEAQSSAPRGKGTNGVKG